MEAPRQLTLSAPGEDALLRIVQEALTNVERHSGASRVVISLVLADGGLRLAVADDGRGLPADLAGGAGLGLTTMRERVEAQGGSFGVRDVSPGTCVEIAVPALIAKDPA